MNMITLELRLEYADEAMAAAVHAATLPDNGGFVISELRGKTIFFSMSASTAGALRNTADDLLACVKAAEESSGLVVAGPAADLDGDALFE